ncbi:hypothetical protein N9740_08925 [Pseudomonadales bacterium]|nr:hypothetical protein [Pseudomonadales bacterium]
MVVNLVNQVDFQRDQSNSTARLFAVLLAALNGQSVAAKDQRYLDQRLEIKDHSLASVRAEAVRYSIAELEVVDRLIELQFKNMRLLMQAYESVRFAPQLFKQMSLEVTQLEQRVEQSYEDQRREVSRQ